MGAKVQLLSKSQLRLTQEFPPAPLFVKKYDEDTNLSGYKLYVKISDHEGGSYRIMYYTRTGANAVILATLSDNGTFHYNLPQAVYKIAIAGAASGGKNGSIKIEEVYLSKPDKAPYNDAKEYSIDLSKLTASGGLSYSYDGGSNKGTLTAKTASTAGTITYTFEDTELYDFTDATSFVVEYEGATNITNKLRVTNFASYSRSSELYSSKDNWTISDADKKDNFLIGLKTLVWTRASDNVNTGTLTIKSIKFKTSDVVTAVDISEGRDLNNFAYRGSVPTNAINTSVTSGNTIYGDGSVKADNYTDIISGYNKILLSGTANSKARFIFNRTTDSSGLTDKTGSGGSKLSLDGDLSDIEITVTLDSEGKGELDITGLTSRHLNVIKVPNGGSANTVTSIKIASGFSYYFAGSGVNAVTATAALADETVASIDARGLINSTAIALTTANPNCLIYAESGKVSNANNVVVDGTCANLVLTDAKPFKAPTAFTATNATFSKTVNAAGASTMVLPFAVDALPTGVEAYKLTAVAGERATASSVTSIAANQPVLLNKVGDYAFTATSAAIGATGDDPVNGDGILYGVYASQYVPANSYVLQNGNDGLGFYKVAAENTININPFRAYLTAPAAAARSYIGFDFDDDELTGIKMVQHEGAKAEGADTCYDLSGRRVAQPTKGLYIVNGKKYVVK